MTSQVYLRKIIPIGILYSGSLVCSNLPYLTLSVAFIQMLKGLGPACVLFATYSLGLAQPTSRTIFNVLVIVAGCMIASFGEIKFVLSGVIFSISGTCFEAYRLALIQRLLSSDDDKMDPLVSLYYFAPACSVMIFGVALFTEIPRITLSAFNQMGTGTLLANASVAFLLNVSGVLLVSTFAPASALPALRSRCSNRLARRPLLSLPFPESSRISCLYLHQS